MYNKSMTSKAKFLLAVAMLFSAGNSVASTFINVFLMRSTHNSIDLVIWQSILNYLILLIAFVSGTRLLSKLSITKIFRLGIIAQALYYVIILIMRNNLLPFIVPLGIFSGLGQGLYWFSLNLLIGDIVTEDNQAKFFSYQQMMGFIFGIVVPALSGFLIVRMGGLSGYYVLFAISIFLFLFGIFLIKNISGFKTEKKMNILGVLKLRGNRYWDSNAILSFSMGFKGVLNSLIFVLFAYLIFKNESTMGNLGSFQAILSAISSLIFARLFQKSHTRMMYFITCSLSFLTFVFLALFANPIMMITGYVIFGIIQSWGSAIANAMNYRLSTRGGNGFSQREYIVASEFPIALGRVLGLLLALLLTQILPSALTAYRFLFIATGLMWMLEFIIIDYKVKWLKND
ncbi:MFS transporter [Lactococcus allomyrinae]|uniref:MFS transporter n=2 Tax=Lactococcus allomyrinae TaxID=2419773 RepID=A0A387BQS8_9LACT|nr:MFS transporter [Lactococcus allomyrinae]